MINTDFMLAPKNCYFGDLETLTWINTHTKIKLILIFKTIYTFKLILTTKSVKLEGVQGLWEKGEKRKKEKQGK